MAASGVVETNQLTISLYISGKNTIIPIITEIIAEINTPEAARSFARLIFLLYSGETTSDKYSIAVLKHSLTNTSPEAKAIAIQSEDEILRNMPANKTITRINR